jgi:hypothetical protein
MMSHNLSKTIKRNLLGQAITKAMAEIMRTQGLNTCLLDIFFDQKTDSAGCEAGMGALLNLLMSYFYPYPVVGRIIA